MALTKIDDRGLKTPIDLLDNEKIRLGTGNDLQLFHDGSDSYINSRTGNLYLAPTTGTENGVTVVPNGEIRLYYDNSKKFETTSSGISITGGLLTTAGSGFNGTATFSADAMFDGTATNFSGGNTAVLWDKSDDRLEFADNTKLSFGQSYDLQIYHDGSYSNVENSTGNLHLRSAANCYIQVGDGSGGWENAVRTYTGGAVELYYNDSKKFETTSEGIETQGELHFKAPNSNTGEQVGRIEWWNENDAGVMAKIGVDRTGGQYAPADLVFSTSGNVDTTAHGGDGDITERLRINTAGFVGINKTSALRSGIHLKSHSNGWVGGILLEENHETCGWNIHPDDNNWLLFGYNSDTTASPGSADHKFNIRNTGDVEIVNGNLVVASGHGIDFSATSDASPTSELLDDYEEGTFTPAYITPGNANTTFAFSHQRGYYTKVGNIVTVNIYIQGYVASNSGSTGNDYLRVGGLPFAPAAVPSGNVRHSPSYAIGTLYKIEADNVYAYTHGGETSIRLFVHTNGGTGTALNSSQANQNTTEIFLTGTYMV